MSTQPDDEPICVVPAEEYGTVLAIATGPKQPAHCTAALRGIGGTEGTWFPASRTSAKL